LAILLFSLALVVASCKRPVPLDTKPLDTAGMNYDAIKQLKAMGLTFPEVSELARARGSGFSDAGCIEAYQIIHGRGQPFNEGDAIAGLVQVGMREDNILELVKLDQLGIGVGELQAMRLAGLSDAIVLEVARHHAAGKPVLSGASLSNMRNVGLRESTLLELARRSVPDSETNTIMVLRRHGASEADILRRYPAS
jgi:hypothetical protein